MIEDVQDIDYPFYLFKIVILEKGNLAAMYDGVVNCVEEQQQKPVWRVSFQQNNI